MPIAKQFSKLDGAEQESFIGELENLLRGNAGDYELYKELWDEFVEVADSDRRVAVLADVREEVLQRISNNQEPEHLTPVIEIMQSMSGEMGESQGGQFMERLSNRLTDNLNANQQKAVIRQIAGFDEYYGKENQILDRVKGVLQQSNNNAVTNAAEDLIDQIEKRGKADQKKIDEIREGHFD
jgi:hypothetical protein